MEVSFPRGGKKSIFQKTTDDRQDDLFKVNDHGKRKKAKKKTEKKKKVDTQTEIPVIIEQLNYKTLSEGMVVLGCIQEVLNYSVTVVLSGGIHGKVPITNISESYTRLLQTFSENPEAVAEIVVSPTSMFTPGLCFPLKVLCKEGEFKEKKKITLSMNPKDVNESLTKSCLYHEMTLLAAVESVEDHGYIMDVGIKGLQGFLSNANAAAFVQKSNEGRPLAVGQPLLCQINMPNMKDGPLAERTLTLIAKHKGSENLVPPDKPLNLHNLLPGIVIKGEVKMVRKEGLVVECHGFAGCVGRDHLRKPWDDPLKYTVGEQVDCTVLFQKPITHTLNLSLLPRPTPANLKKRYAGLKAGDLVEEAAVAAIFNKSIYLRLPGNVKAIALYDQLSDLEDINIPNTFKVGDVHRSFCSLSFVTKMQTLSIY